MSGRTQAKPDDNASATAQTAFSAIDTRALRHCLGQYATGVTVVTTAVDGQIAGVTANSFSSVSLDPPLVLWSISRKSRSFAAFDSAGSFAINVLSSDQIHLAQRFSSRDEDKFAGVSWTPGIGGAPLIAGAVAHIECRRETAHDGGDHVILIGRVARHATFEAEALLFSQGRYSVAEDHPEVSGAEAPTTSGIKLSADTPFLTLMFQAYQAIAGSFEEHRAAEGVTRSQVRVLTGLSESPGLTLAELARTKYLSERDAEDSVGWLLERHMLLQDSSGRLSLSPHGWSLITAINQRWRNFEARQLSGLPESEIAFARRFFKKLILRTETQLPDRDAANS